MPINLYNASAGSGKTYALATIYLGLLIRNPDDYKNIIVTSFTNKATYEIKDRILLFLTDIYLKTSNGLRLIKTIKKQYKELNDRNIIENSKLALEKLLYDYESFNVLTIDKLFNKLVSKFNYEGIISEKLEIKIDDEKNSLLHEIFDDFLENYYDDSSVSLLIKFLSENQYKTNKMANNVVTLVNQVLTNLNLRNQFDNKFFLKQLNNLSNEIAKKKKKLNQTFNEISNNSKQIITNAGLNLNNFAYGKKGCINVFYKANFNDIESIERVKFAVEKQELFNKKDKISHEKLLGNYGKNKLLANLNKIIKMFDNKENHTIFVIQNSIVILLFLKQFINYIKNFSKKNKLVFLFEIHYFLNKLLFNNQLAFIYEKANLHYKHFLIDEFQDTSVGQWNILKPMLEETLSYDNNVSIVGDPKQSIYRWRNSNYQLMTEIAKDINQNSCHKNIELPYNWRSHKNIVDFNNKFFNFAKLHYSNNLYIQNIYKYCTQKVKNTNEIGFVSIKSIRKSDSWRKDNYTKQYLHLLSSDIQNLTNNYNYQHCDLAILTKTHKDLQLIADKLKNLGIKTILLKNKLIDELAEVKLIIFIFKYVTNNNSYDKEGFNNLLLALFANDHEIINSLKQSILDISTKENQNILFLLNHINRVLNDTNLLLTNSLGLLTDIIYSFIETEKKTDSLAFLYWYEKNKNQFKIQNPNTENAVKLMTIHQAKGLEFKVVFLPFINWEFYKVKDLNWLDFPYTDKYSAINTYPVRLNKKLDKTTFKELALNEKKLFQTDSLNLLYVGFTRAKENLYLYTDENYQGKNKVKDVEGILLNEFINKEIKEQDSTNELYKEYQYGSLNFNNNIAKIHENENLFKISTTNYKLAINTNISRSKDLDISSQIIGVLIHNILEKSYNLSDLIKNIETEKLLNPDLVSEINRIIIDSKIIDNKIFQSWFNNDLIIHNEQEIINKNKVKRIDRLILDNNNLVATIIDFKSGQFNKSSHQNHQTQLIDYTKTINEIYHNYTIKSYLCYLADNEIIKVN